VHRARAVRAGFRKFSKKNSCIARARRARTGLTVYPPWIQIADVSVARTQSCDRKSKFGLRHATEANLALSRDEVRILIFDYPAEH
jgi:hypothetical protein